MNRYVPVSEAPDPPGVLRRTDNENLDAINHNRTNDVVENLLSKVQSSVRVTSTLPVKFCP
jgi:hypothetical protein